MEAAFGLSVTLTMLVTSFLVVMYLLIPGTTVFFCSVHSKITCTLLPFLAIVLVVYFVIVS